jgi:hypothetical protein
LNSLAVSGWVEDVTHLLAISEGSVWNLNTLVIVSIGGSYEELPSLKSIEIVSDISLFEWMIPNSLMLSGTIDCCSHFVDV